MIQSYIRIRRLNLCLLFITLTVSLSAQQPPASTASNRLTINLQDALARARRYGAQIQTANIAALIAKEDTAQARAGRLPTLSGLNQFIYTEGNGTSSGVFVANDGVHVYNEQLVGHEDLLAFLRRGQVHFAEAAEAVAKARADVAARGLASAVIQDYYTIATAVHRVDNAQQSLSEARNFLDITQKQEQGGEAAHSDVIKAQIQVQQRQRDLQEAELSVQKAKIALGVLMFPSLQVDYDIVDDLEKLPVPPTLPEATAQATSNNPDLRAARANVSEARLGVSVARYAYLPSFGLDVFYGINANQFAAYTDYPTQQSGRSTQPMYLVPSRQNLGYSAQATLNVPLWDWGSIHSRVKQASLRREQAELDLNTTEKQLQGALASSYAEAQAAFNQVSSLRDSSTLSDQSLRLTLLRYQAGEATALEVVDAQTTATVARNAYDDGLLRYRVALATLETLTGTF